jgi:hypothetical protein
MYVTGGAGTEAVDRLKSMEMDFNLKLVFATTSGAYLSDVHVAIADSNGRVVLNATSERPMLMAKLPAAIYKVNATFVAVRKSVRSKFLRTNSLSSTSGGRPIGESARHLGDVLPPGRTAPAICISSYSPLCMPPHRQACR